MCKETIYLEGNEIVKQYSVRKIERFQVSKKVMVTESHILESNIAFVTYCIVFGCVMY